MKFGINGTMKEAVHPAGGSKWAWKVGYAFSLKSEKCVWRWFEMVTVKFRVRSKVD